MCSGKGKSSPPHPQCASPSGLSQWSAYRFHDMDPLFYSDGVQLLVRNGDTSGRIPFGPPGYTGKCYSLSEVAPHDRQAAPGPGPSTVDVYAWVYEFAS